MADDTIRIGAQFNSAEAQADVRALGREFGMLPKYAGQGVKNVNRELGVLGETVKSLGAGLRSAMPGLAGFGLGAAGIGFAVSEAARGLGRFAKSITDLKYLSKELGLTTQELQGLTTAAERVGMAPEEMSAALVTFKHNTEDFKLRIGSVREEMVKMGATDLLDRIMNSKNTLEGLKHAFDFAEAAERAGRPEVGRRIMELLTGNAKMARNTWKEIRADIDATPIISEEEMARAKAYNDLMISLGRGWDHLKQKFVLGLFDTSRWEQEKERFKNFGAPPGPAGEGAIAPETGLSDMGIPQFQSGGVMPNTGLALLHAGETVIPPGGDILEGADDTLIKTTKEGTFQGLMQFASYQAAGGGAMQGLGGLPGFGGGGGGGGGGSGGGGGGGGGGGRSASLGSGETTGSSPGAGMSTSAPDQGDRPGHYTGTVTLGGKEFQYGTGGQGRGSMPIGTHAINIGKGDIGDIGKGIGSIATVGKIGGDIYDPKIKAMRSGMQIHAGFSEKLEYLKSKGCFAIKPSQWPAFKKALIEENKRTPGGLQLSIGKDGRAQISARADAPGGSRQAAQGAVRPDSAPPPVSGVDAPQTERIDTANDAQAQPPGASGAVDVKITSDGTAAKGGNGSSPDLFQPTKITNHQQMGKTEEAGVAGHAP